jgi:hypothetical protein
LGGHFNVIALNVEGRRNSSDVCLWLKYWSRSPMKWKGTCSMLSEKVSKVNLQNPTLFTCNSDVTFAFPQLDEFLWLVNNNTNIITHRYIATIYSIPSRHATECAFKPCCIYYTIYPLHSLWHDISTNWWCV